MSQEVNVRALALDIITACLEENGFCNVLLKQVLDKYSYLDRRDRAFLSRLSIGTIERAITMDACIEQFTDTKVRKMKPVVRNILRMSAYQIYEMDGVSAYGVVNEAVELTKFKKQRSFAGFVNGVLRSMIREYEAFQVREQEEAYSYEHSFLRYRRMFPKMNLDQAAGMPSSIFTLLRRQYKDQAYDIMDAFYQHASYGTNIHLLGNTRPIPEAVFAELAEKGLIAPHPYTEEAFAKQDGIYLCKELDEFMATPLFTDGYAMVQDFSSSVVGRLIPVKPNMKVLDLCAAPGGKSIHIADRIGSIGGEVIACDIYEEKVARISDNAKRTHRDNVTALLWDATFEKKEWIGAFDVVIADVPCSGLGIIGNKPDIKYRVGRDCDAALAEITALQRQILTRALSYVKPGGFLMYSTCTINRGENEDQVSWIREHFPFVSEDISKELPSKYQLTGIGASEFGAVFLPGIHKTEGFFVARLKKTEEAV